MAKNIVLLSDGTGNSSAQLMKTNVWRIYESLQLDDSTKQVACYDDGVGTSAFKPLAIIGGAAGVGLKRNVLRLYRFLCEHYEPGDRIYLFGFSRGAFTVRVLTGLICSQGIIRTPRGGMPREEAVAFPHIYGVFGGELARRARWAYREFRKQFNQTGLLVTAARKVRDVVFRLREFRKPRYRKEDNHQVNAIEFVGVWDTVDAYGLPIDELTAGIDRWVWPLSMPDLKLPAQVKKACHVLALDDERNTFHPLLWDESEEAGQQGATNVQRERVSQVWFAGMHSNVGGGYPDDSLSYVSLEWMTDQVQALPAPTPLIFSKELLQYHVAKKDPLGRIYDSRKGIKGYYRYNPRRIEWLTNGLEHERRFFTKHAGLRKLVAVWDRAVNWLSRKIVKRPPREEPTVTIRLPKIHESVFQRIASAPEAYAPIVLPQHYAIVRKDGGIVSADTVESTPARLKRIDSQEAAWDLVWWRRVVYFTAVGFTAILLLRPFREEAATIGQMLPQGIVGRLVESLGEMLPSFTSPITHYYAVFPGELLMLLIPILGLSRIGSRLQAAICGRMRRIWLRTVPPPGMELGELTPTKTRLYRIRSSDWYQAAFAILRRRALPTVTGIAALLWLAGALNRAPFEVANLSGLFCTDGAQVHDWSTASTVAREMKTNEACNSTGVRLAQGDQYRITVTQTEPWKDDTVDASFPRGFSTWSPGLGIRQRALFAVAAPFRRSWGDRWFALTGRIGERGADYYPLNEDTSITAQTSGELFLFVNDAVLPVGPGSFGWNTAYYANNLGRATVTIEKLARANAP